MGFLNDCPATIRTVWAGNVIIKSDDTVHLVLIHLGDTDIFSFHIENNVHRSVNIWVFLQKIMSYFYVIKSYKKSCFLATRAERVWRNACRIEGLSF